MGCGDTVQDDFGDKFNRGSESAGRDVGFQDGCRF